MNRNKLINGSYYHVYNRGVDKRAIFHDKQDYGRFVEYMYALNSDSKAANLGRKIYNNKTSLQEKEVPGREVYLKCEDQKLLSIICFCIMPNHFHFIFQQEIEDGISKFMQRIATGYAMYYNQKYKRKGSLFEGRFKSKLVESDEYILHLSRYIHLNPIKTIKPSWKKELPGYRFDKEIKNFLFNYKWSSFQDYIGKKNLPSLINNRIIKSLVKDSDKYLDFTMSATYEQLQPVKV